MDIGMVGLAVMGRSLALNMADHGFKVSAWNYTPDLTQQFSIEHPHPNVKCFFELNDFVASLERPRKIMFMIMAGAPVDAMIESLIPLLEKGDIILDGGNSFFEDTRRRHDRLKALGINYFGTGISGGESGARFGPCIMPGGDPDAYQTVRPIFEAIAAQAQGEPCCAYIGSDGAGHYVKMVHNGIEYADMQLIAESYLLLKNVGGLDNPQLARTFREWNGGELESFLIKITGDIFDENDPEGEGQLIDKIVDSAGQKGTGRWTSIEAMTRGVNTSIMTAACNARIMSNLNRKNIFRAAAVEKNSSAPDQNFKAAAPIGEAPDQKNSSAPDPSLESPPSFVEDVRRSLYVGKIAAYAQGFALYRAASDHFNWNLDLGRIASIFRAGCIIQARFLDRITDAYRSNPALENLMLDQFFLSKIESGLPSLRRTISRAIERGVPIPALANALEYIDAFASEHLGANLIQAQRDYFGAHTFKRIDREGSFHHEWQH